jgi:hypothetical protein
VYLTYLQNIYKYSVSPNNFGEHIVTYTNGTLYYLDGTSFVMGNLTHMGNGPDGTLLVVDESLPYEVALLKSIRAPQCEAAIFQAGG